MVDFINERWDDLSPLIVGARLIAAQIEANTSQFTLQQGDTTHRLEVPEDLQLLEPYIAGEIRRWHPTDNLWDAWVIREESEFL